MATLTHEPQTTTSRRSEQSVRQRERGRERNGAGVDRLARGLGWFSIGLGVAELVAPKAIARLVGTRNHSSLIRAYGLREIAAGVGILATPKPSGWLWGRVAGDVVDLATLGAAMKSRNKPKTAVGIASVAGVTVLDVVCAKRLSAQSNGFAKSGRAEASLIVDRTPEECYQFWRKLENLPRIMTYLQSVRTMGDRRSHWIAEVGGKRIEWDAEIEADVQNERITWNSAPDSDLTNSGSVEFERAPGRRGTIVRVQMDYGNMLHALGAAAAKAVGQSPEQIIRKELRRFKQVMETGEAITTEGQPAGRLTGATWLDQIAR